MEKNERWEKFGVVGVDSGMLMICDPCYIDSEWKKHEGEDIFDPKFLGDFSYNGCCVGTSVENKNSTQLNYRFGHAGVGVAFRSGLGDGVYDVWGRIREVEGWGERVTEVLIKLVDDVKAEEILEYFKKTFWSKKND